MGHFGTGLRWIWKTGKVTLFLLAFIYITLQLQVPRNVETDQTYRRDEMRNPAVAAEEKSLNAKVETPDTDLKDVKNEPTAASSEKSLQQSVKDKLSSLPPPLWPMKNHKTAEAISAGIYLGPPSTSKLATIVTAYYEFKSKHPTSQYKTWIVRLLKASDPMIIFVEPGSVWQDFVVENRQHAPTIVIPQKFDDMVMNTTFSADFWQEQWEIDPEKKIHTKELYKIWNEKLVYTLSVAQLNPFDTETFAWMDAGYFHRPTQKSPIVRLNITAAGVPTHRTVYLHVRDSDRGVLTAGNAWIMTGRGLLEMYKSYFKTFWHMVKVEKAFIGSDQKVQMRTCYWYTENCHLVFPGHFRDWRFMANRVFADENFDVKDGKGAPTGFPFKEGGMVEADVPPFPEGLVGRQGIN